MAVSSILVPLFGDDLDTACLDAASQIAALAGGHITGQFVESNPTGMPMVYAADGIGFYLTEEFAQAMSERNTTRLKTARESFAHWASADHIASVSVEFVVDRQESAVSLRDRAVVNDLVVMTLPDSAVFERADLFETVLFGAGRPILAVPVGVPLPTIGAAAVIAWNGRSEAGRAVSAALPLLRRAASVTVLHAGDAETPLLKPVLAFLARHDVVAEGRALPAQGDVAASLLDEAARLGAGLFVLGAYGHSRARELVFGGVTRHVLRHAKIPVLLVH